MHRIIIGALFVVSLASCSSRFGSDDATKRTRETNNVADVNRQLGVEYLRRGAYEQALRKLDKSLEHAPNYALTYSILGFLYQQIGEIKKARLHYEKALSLNSTNSSILNNYGQFLCHQKQYDEAQEVFLQAANNPLYATPETVLTNSGTCALSAGNVALAEVRFRAALDKNARFSIPLIRMSNIAYTQNKYLSAMAYLQRYLEVSRHTPASLWLGIRIVRELGDEDALASYELLLRNQFSNSKEAGFLNNISQ